ncbi:phosphotransferase [Helcobacillus sp. ACRRO]|uniref:phosphotransferase n=1 Tax=Helcobacillus sp. ACRRO TaxID=2918202 RepID=UPI001EF489A6|nr:phosphotransferase [Helcobacillus sp. ACRRO]MCG7426067.1 phosphotransferase [Helcobacillus sp. ACRRO]
MVLSLDGSELLTSPQAGSVLEAAVTNAGGILDSWSLDQVDHRPSRSTKALFRTRVRWPKLDGADAEPRDELFGVAAHIGEAEKNVLSPEQSLVMTDGDMNVRVWRYPHDPWLPALQHVCYPDVLHRTLIDLGIPTGYAPGTPIPVEVVSYRPGRRAVLKAALADRTVYLKVMQPHTSGEVVAQHNELLRAGVPVPQVLAHRSGLVVLAELPGTVLAQALVEDGPEACSAEDLIALLDRFPSHMFAGTHRPAWTESAGFYAGVVASSMPQLQDRLDVLVHRITTGLARVESRIGQQPTDVVHGDFYEAQVFVDRGRVVGVLDIDTIGPGRRADDLACMFAHISVLADYANLKRIPLDVHERVAGVIRQWYPVFARRVDPQELALRAAGVVLSLATGPHRQQERDWEVATEAMVRVAETWVEVSEQGRRYTGPMPGGLIIDPSTAVPPVEPPAELESEVLSSGAPTTDTRQAMDEGVQESADGQGPSAADFHHDPTIPMAPVPQPSAMEIHLAATANRADEQDEHSLWRRPTLSPPTPVRAPWNRRRVPQPSHLPNPTTFDQHRQG